MHKAYSDDKTKSASANEEKRGVSDIAQPSASLAPLTDAEAKELEQAIENGEVDDRVEHTPIGTDEVLRVHGVYMSESREFAIRTSPEGKLELWDAKAGKKL